MNVIVLGAGLTGVTTAWYLAQAGHQVTVVERQPQAGMETSYANGGQISVSHPEPWANPGAPRQILRWMFREDAPLKFRPHADSAQWGWAMRFLVECLPSRARRNADAIARLAVYSRDCLRALRRDTAIEYDCLTRGILHLFFSRHDFASAAARATSLSRHGIEARVLSAAECVAVEPALAACAETIHGGLYAPDDESGDAHLFTQRLAALAAARGVVFRYGWQVAGWDETNGRIFGVYVTEPGGVTGVLQAEAIVTCMGSYSPRLAAAAGDRLPIYPVKGYSVTLPVETGAGTPEVSITDESHRIVCSRLAGRLRIAGTAELNGYNLDINARRCQAILDRAARLFPRAVAGAEPEFWAGLRPATPSNVPIIGRGKNPAVFYNTGHGTLGWTLACGSAKAITALVGGSAPELDFPFLRTA